MTLGDVARRAQSKAVVDLLAGAELELRTGPEPEDADAPDSGALLATLLLARAGEGVRSGDADVVCDGLAAHFRVRRDGAVVLQGTVTGEGGDGDIRLSNTSLRKDGAVALGGLTVMAPRG